MTFLFVVPEAIVKSPVIVSPPALLNLVPIELVVVVAKLASSPRAAANSFNVSKAAGALSTMPATAV